MVRKDSSIDTKMFLNGTEYIIDTIVIQYRQFVDSGGNIQFEAEDNSFSITLSGTVDEQLDYWMFHNKVTYSGSIVFIPFGRTVNTTIAISFTDGRCGRYSKHIGNSLTLVTLLIVAEKIVINELK